MNIRTEIINMLLQRYDLKSYLEIGVYDPDENFNLIKAETRHGVEPVLLTGKQYEYVYDATSDEFFEAILDTQKYDLIFIDGLHTAQQSYRDAKNALKHLNDNGFIVMHDCNPLQEAWAVPYEQYVSGPWNGDVFKAFIRLKGEFKDYSCFVVDEDFGCGIITSRPILKNIQMRATSLDWNSFDKFRGGLLQLIPYNEFKNILK